MSPLHAQVNTSAIAGVVTDKSGSVVPNASVTVTQAATGLVRKVTTHEGGEYVVPQLSPGSYEVKVEASGFQQAIVKAVDLAIAQRERVDFAPTLGTVSEQIEVTAHAEIAETETASLGQLIQTRVIKDLPLNGRNYLTLGALSPGVIPQIPSSQGPASFVSSTTGRSDRSILVGGQRESSASYLLDGVELRNPRVGDTSINPSLDAIQEFKIQRNFFPAEFGNSPGIINVATKSGTNQWHGSAYEFVRDQTFDARNFFSTGPEPLKRNQYGARIGAPILKDKLSGSTFTKNGVQITPGQDFGSTNRSLYWFIPNAFSVTAPLRFGTSGRDIIASPAYWNSDISLFKDFFLTERIRLQFRAECFDALNQVRFNPPVLDVSSPFFGQIQSAQSPRIFQLGLRLQF